MLNFAINLAQEAGKLIKDLRNNPLEIHEKGISDLVTNADLASEEFIIKTIKERYPQHLILGEESADLSDTEALKELGKAKYIWIIDPIDGTTNFVQNIPFYSVSIALFKTKSSEISKNFQYLEGHVELGVVYIPELNQLFFAQKDRGAHLNNVPIHVSDKKHLKNAVAATGFSRNHHAHNFPYFMKMSLETLGLRRLGSAAIDLCYTACGKLDVYWEFGLKPWDIAAGALILTEAGGQLSDTHGNPLDLFGQDLLATNSHLHTPTLKLFNKV